MIIPIELSQVITLVGLHFVIGILLYIIGHLLLPKNSRLPLALLLTIVWAWSALALWSFYIQNMGFLGWFLDPSGEQNSAALLSTLFLMMIGLASLSLCWAQVKEKQILRARYWILVSSLFIFLAIDEYFSIHETIVFWRAAYLILGASVGLITLVLISKSEPKVRKTLLIFLIGLGTMGVSGVVLDAFSTQSVMDVGSIELTFLQCNETFLGVYCRDYSNTEELMELFGSGIMVLSLMTLIAQRWEAPQQKIQSRWVYALGLTWVGGLIAWMWIIPSIQASFAQTATTDYGDISIIAYDLSADNIEAGDTLDLTLYMQVNDNIFEDYSMSVHLYTQALPDINSIQQDDMTLGDFKYPTRAWFPTVAVRNHFELIVPDELATNQSYQLIAILWQGEPSNRIPIQETILPVFGDGTTLVIEGISAPSPDTAPIPASARYDFSEGFSLAGYDLPETASLGADVTLDLWWQAESDIDVVATQFLHWINTETEDVFVFDQVPFAGAFPTQDWIEGMLVQDSWTITLPNDMPTGTYRVQMGMLYLGNPDRIPVTDANGAPVQDNSIVLAEVVIGE